MVGKFTNLFRLVAADFLLNIRKKKKLSFLIPRAKTNDKKKEFKLFNYVHSAYEKRKILHLRRKGMQFYHHETAPNFIAAKKNTSVASAGIFIQQYCESTRTH